MDRDSDLLRHKEQGEADSESDVSIETYSIGETASMIGSTVKTVRYYDEIGLVTPSSYTEGGHRLYTNEDIRQLQLITTLRYLDFEISEISKMVTGEIEVDKALAWQIDSLETQVHTLTNMISILQQAREHQGDSLRYISDQVHSRTVSPKKRSQFLAEKLDASKLFEGIPAEWRSSLLYFFDKYIIHQVKLTAKQTIAWNELQELVSDPQFLLDLKEDSFLLFNMVDKPRLQAGAWVRTLEDIHLRLNKALKQKLPAGSPFVQTIVEDTAMLHASSEQATNKEDFFRYFATHSRPIGLERIERFETLCSILSPKFRQFQKGNQLLLQGIQWKLAQMQK